MIPPPYAPDFLASLGWGNCEIRPLAGDASFRRYFRVFDGGRSAVLMDAPPPHEDPRPFIAVAEWLEQAGLSAPHILGRDLERGLLLIDDLGDDRLREALDDAPGRETELYEIATDLLVHLHARPAMPGLKPHGLVEWLSELHLFTNWYCPAMGIEPDVPGWDLAWAEVLAPVAADGLGPTTVLRDYHAENIMLVAGRKDIGHFGLLDFQDAVAGHPAYDLVSVLEDARRDVSPSVERAMIERYVKARGQGAEFERAYWTLAAQRNTRILGVFTRLWMRDGKAHYLNFQPRMWGLLERDLEHPALAPVRAWFDANVPADKRAAAFTDEARRELARSNGARIQALEQRLAPAADRRVTFSHNSAELTVALERLDSARSVIKVLNEPDMVDNAVHIKTGIEHIRRCLERGATTSVQVIRYLLIDPFKRALESGLDDAWKLVIQTGLLALLAALLKLVELS